MRLEKVGLPNPDAIYRRRFDRDAIYRNELWRVLCRDFFQRYIGENATVLDVAAGHCEFINNIRAPRRIAVDINEDTRRIAEPGVEVYTIPSTDLSPLADASVDVVFMSNFLEHLTRERITATVRECYRVLKSGGRIIILQPNIRYCGRDYWMFFDHITPIDDRAVCELLELIGFRTVRSIPRFLPFTTKSRLPRSLLFVRLYLRLRILWKFLGGQALVTAER